MTDPRDPPPPAPPGRDEARSFDIDGHTHDKPIDGLVRNWLAISWGDARTLIERGKVFVDGAPMRDTRAKMQRGMRVEIRPNARRLDGMALDDSLIVHVDDHIVVVRKPAGISTIPYDQGERGTLQEKTHAWLVRRARHAPNASLGVVHRIDKQTSGLVVFTRTLAAKRELTQAFRLHTIERRYVALVHGVIATPATSRSYLVENRGDGMRGSAKDQVIGARIGQLAITHFAPLKVLSRDKCLDGATAILCRLETGRTHQIRIHLAEARTPLIGDTVYTRDRLRAERPLIEAPRQMLHAIVLGFEHPITHAPMRFVEPLPEDIKSVARKLSGEELVVEESALV